MNIQHIVEQPDEGGEQRCLLYEFTFEMDYLRPPKLRLCAYLEQSRKSNRHSWVTNSSWGHPNYPTSMAAQPASIEKPIISLSIMTAVIAKIIGSIEIVE